MCVACVCLCSVLSDSFRCSSSHLDESHLQMSPRTRNFRWDIWTLRVKARVGGKLGLVGGGSVVRWVVGSCGGWTHRAEKFTTITTLSMWLLWCETLMEKSYSCPTLRFEQRYSFKGGWTFTWILLLSLLVLLSLSAIKRHLGETRIIHWCVAVWMYTVHSGKEIIWSDTNVFFYNVRHLQQMMRKVRKENETIIRLG